MNNNLTDISKTKNILASVLAFICVFIIICLGIIISPIVVVSYIIYNIIMEARYPDDGDASNSRVVPRKSIAVSHH